MFDYPTALRFRCIKCGICCGDTEEKVRHILVLAPEAEQIAKATLQPIANFATKIKGKALYRYEMKKRAEDGKCVFLEKNRCAIYSLRPLICRFYPFELKTAHSQKYMFRFTEECPGINKGKMLGEDYFSNMFQLAHVRCMQKADSTRGS